MLHENNFSVFEKFLNTFIESDAQSNKIQEIDLNRPFSYSGKDSQSNDTLLHFVEFSNVHNSDRSSNATRSNLAYKNV